MLRRKMWETLEGWQENTRKREDGLRKALVIEGARQTGKTYLVRRFGQERYDDFVEVNFYEDTRAARLISQCASARETISALSLLVGHEVSPRKTLVFLDEVQEAPQVITQIKFLVEDGRFDVVASGSLLGVELKNAPSFPVGYVQIERMYPLDFEEFCWALGADDDLMGTLREAFSRKEPLPDALHEQFTRMFRLYLVVGGMPEAVQRYINTRYDLGAVRDTQASIISQYRIDIAKYAKGRELQVRAIFDALPSELAKENKRFQLKSLKKKATFERYANDFAWLVGAGVAHKCNVVSEPAYPLQRTEDARKFKLYSSDTGLLLAQYPTGVAALALEGSRSVNFGAVYENAVAQELASSDVPLRYFRSSRKGEVDFLLEEEDCSVLPVEVKSGKDYKLHAALNNLMETPDYGVKEAVVLTEANVSVCERGGKPVHYLPLYLTFCLAEQAVKHSQGSHASEILSALNATPPEF